MEKDDNALLEKLVRPCKKDFETLGQLMKEGKLPASQKVFSIYHKYDMVNETCDYTSGFIYAAPPKTEGVSGIETGQIASHKAFRVDHTGSYRHLGNAWSAAMGCQRSQGYKMLKAVPMYEVYENDPHSVAEKELKTDIFIPVK